jgi:hypothetical protein
MLEKSGFDFSGLDSVAVQLELQVLAPENLDLAIREVPAQIAGSIQALPRLPMLRETDARALVVSPVRRCSEIT